MLRELHGASRRLIRVETREAVCEVAVDAARRIPGLPLNGLWLYDADRDRLNPAAWPDQGAEQFGEPSVFPVDASLVGRVFREGTHRAPLTTRPSPGRRPARRRRWLARSCSRPG